MRRLLLIAVVGVAALFAGLWQPSGDTSAAGLNVTLRLYHPTNSVMNNSYLYCGWHWNCNGEFPDSDPRGLDWRPCNWSPTLECPTAQEITWIRLKGYTSAGSGWVARAPSGNGMFAGCEGIFTDVTRIADGAVFGRVWNMHAAATGTPYMNVSASPSGTQNAGVIGAFTDPDDDPCSSYWHTMQQYSHGAAGSGWSRNSGPGGIFWTEANCNHWTTPFCAQPYGIWATHEYSFSFTS